jgi:hypothetical protein
MQQEVWFFIGIFVFIFVMWIAIGGPTRAVRFDVPTIAWSSGTSTPLGGGGAFFSLPQAPYGIGTARFVLEEPEADSDDAPSDAGGASPLPYASLPGAPAGIPSPYYGAVTLERTIGAPGASDPALEQVTLRVSPAATSSIDITGWTLVSSASRSAGAIPGGTPVPAAGIVNPVQDIVLAPGERAIVATGPSPIGISFKENACIGYFGQYQRFDPVLPLACPDPLAELARFGGGAAEDPSCRAYVSGLPRCAAAAQPPPALTEACRAFLVSALTYNGCTARHAYVAYFHGSVWRIHLGRAAPLWGSAHDVVKLLDREGRTVDAFAY